MQVLQPISQSRQSYPYKNSPSLHDVQLEYISQVPQLLLHANMHDLEVPLQVAQTELSQF